MSRRASGEATAGAATGRPRGRVRLTPGGAALVIVVVALLFALTVPVRTLLQQRSDLAHLQQEATALQQQNQKLQQQVHQLNDPAYLERLARECLGMVRPGEIAFVVVPKGGGSSPGAPGSPNC